MSKEQSKKNRDRFAPANSWPVQAAATAGAATLGFPMIAKGQAGPNQQCVGKAPGLRRTSSTNTRSTSPGKVNEMGTGGDLRIEVLPAGSVVPAFGLLERCPKGPLEEATAYSCTTTASRMRSRCGARSGVRHGRAQQLLSWHKYGGGKDLLAKLYASIGANVVSYPYGPMFTQPLAGSRSRLRKLPTSRALKYRTVGLSVEACSNGMGARSTRCRGGEIVLP